jgi:hypothetical protein
VTEITSPPVHAQIHRLLILGFVPLVFCVLGADSQLLAGQPFTGQAIANLLAIAYFALMVINLRREEQMMALIFVPFSFLFECLFSLGFELYTYRLEAVPLYVPFGHGILFTTGLLIANSPIFAKKEQWKLTALTLYSANSSMKCNS